MVIMIQFVRRINQSLEGEGVKDWMLIVVMQQGAKGTLGRELHFLLSVEERYLDESSGSYIFFPLYPRYGETDIRNTIKNSLHHYGQVFILYIKVLKYGIVRRGGFP